ncbi:uncharacterized protein MONBRDRAFT_37508 [Monosiga brevicollis MX1]|uniref:Aminopeptidase P N-terminal domain-containing protein n=1 Tax=Monosiga brevicollis TaxID=81824 RepID=A9V258_MONBE|nr:uncharacterized protein MONBRDRAFT_37508 [Monosiga brevicollis MX1]EDQ88196.1 predicted protein [Monosiga brevicollis MX1]|eukprot:XP_001746789.1 hypothetical protein [Monosiga brevicollis MX1]
MAAVRLGAARLRAAEASIWQAAISTACSMQTEANKIATKPFPAEEYHARRSALANILPPNSLVLVAANTLRYASHDIPYRFRQNSNLAYLAPLPEPDGLFILRTDAARRVIHTALGVLRKDPHRELWDGHRIGPDAAPALMHVDQAVVAELPVLLETVAPHLTDCSGIYVHMGDATPTACAGLLTQLRSQCPNQPIQEVAPYLARLRSVKSPREIVHLAAAGRASALAMNQTFARLAELSSEWEVDASLEFAYRRLGCQGHAYPPVVAAGEHALTLHYVTNDAPLRAGDLLLVDAGAERAGYNADITRTVPISGRFSDAQAELYDAVLRVQTRCLELLMWGEARNLMQLHQQSARMVVEEGKRLGLLSSRATASDARSLMPHSIGHHLGLDVHDPGSPVEPLSPNSVVTVEPGIYVPNSDAFPKAYRGIGIRIEDNVVIGGATEGLQDLTKNCYKVPTPIAEFAAQIGLDNFRISLGSIVAAVYAAGYLAMEPVAGSIASICLLYGSNCALNYATTEPNAMIKLGALHASCWAMQFFGHFVFEGRAPALFDNLFQSLYLAPLFVLLEIMFMFGYRPDLSKSIYDNAERDIKNWKASKSK